MAPRFNVSHSTTLLRPRDAPGSPLRPRMTLCDQEGQEAIEEAKKHLDGEAEEMKTQLEKVNEISHKLASAMYAQSQSEQAGPEGGPEGGPQGPDESGGGDKSSDDDVVDAEFEDISKK